jgi:glycosyltransferase involved in cell wall biosynthesis
LVIVHVITRLLRAGSEENTVATCLAQAQAGHEVYLVHGADWNPLYEGRCKGRVKLVKIDDLVHPVDARRDLAAVVALRRLFLELKPAVVHTHQSKAGIVGRLAARLARVPTIVHGVHVVPFVGVSRGKRMIYLTAERALAGITDAFINVSDGTRQILLEHSVGAARQHFVAHSGMELARFRAAAWPADWRALLGTDRKPPVVLMLAALEDRKRHVAFLEAFREVLVRVPDARLILAGEGPMRGAVEAAIDRLRLRTHVRLLGFHGQPEQLIALSDLTVLTSLREGLPRVVVQSMAGGKPVVITQLPGIAEIVRHGHNGIIVGADDVKRAAETVADLLLDPERLGRLSEGAAGTDVSSWEVDAMCKTITEIYGLVAPQVSSTLPVRPERL